MNHKDMEDKLRQAFEKATPDVLPAVLSGCEKQKGTVIPMTNKKKHVPWRRFAAMAAAFALIIGLGFGFGAYQKANAITASVSLDVNPSIELKLNKNEKVVEVIAHNADGQALLADMDLKGTDLNVAVNALIGSMLRKGLLSDIANSILVSVESDDPQHSALLQQQVTQAVSSLMLSDNFQGAVMSQSVTSDAQIRDLAEQHHISVGKAQLISRIIAQNSRYTFDNLVELSINELNLLSVSGGHPVEGVDTSGNASDKGYIGEEAAKAAALSHCGLTEAEVTGLRIHMDLEDGKMVYEVEFDTAQWEYEYDIDAKTGAVLQVDKEDHEYKEDNNDRPNLPDNSSGITKDEAKQVVLKHAGLAETDISQYRCELDRDDGRVIYEISFRHGTTEYEYDIDAASGQILSWEKEADDDHRRPEQEPSAPEPSGSTPSSDPQYIGTEKAKDIALQKAKVDASQVRDYECEFDMEGKTPVYEISFQVGNREYDVQIHAVTGEILHYETEIDD